MNFVSTIRLFFDYEFREDNKKIPRNCFIGTTIDFTIGEGCSRFCSKTPLICMSMQSIWPRSQKETSGNSRIGCLAVSYLIRRNQH
jgi:hypothetical protein